MGFLDFLKGVGNFVKSGIGKVAGIVSKFAPIVSGIAGAIPTPLTQGIAQAANLVGQVASSPPSGNIGDMANSAAGALQGTALGGVANQVAGAVNTGQNVVQAVQQGFRPQGAPVM
jgi:hypothetical protein